MDLNAVGAVEFGRSLEGLGLNLLVRDVGASVGVMQEVFGMKAFQPTQDFAIMTLGELTLQLHADHTYHAHPLLSLLPESGARGAGAQFHLFEVDPDQAAAAAATFENLVVLQEPTNKPHGLREAFILDADGYCWVPSRRLTDEEVEAVG